MSKSRILEKSIAVILAIMLIVAMIPLGASAADPVKSIFINRNGLVEIGASKGSLTVNADRTAFTDTLAYNASDKEEVTVEIKSDSNRYDRVVYTVDGGEPAVAVASDGIATLSFDVTSRKVSFYITNSAESAKSVDFTISVSKQAISNVTTLASASLTVKVGDPEKEVVLDAQVDNLAKTISVVFPWECTEGTLTAEMDYPSSRPVTADIKLGADGTYENSVAVIAQNGSNTYYTIRAVAAKCLTDLTIGGVSAFTANGTDYEVVMPEDTVMEGSTFELRMSVGKSYTAVMSYTPEVEEGEEEAEPVTFAVEDGGRYTFIEGMDYTLTVYDSEDNDIFVVYHVRVVVSPSTDATMTGFTATAQDEESNSYKAAGTVDNAEGSLDVVLPYGCDRSSVVLNFTAAEGAKVYVGRGATKEYGGEAVDLSAGSVRVRVVAADGINTEYYLLSATVDKQKASNPTVTKAVMTMGAGSEDEKVYEGVASKTAGSIVFKVPYATKASEIQANTTTFAFDVSYGTKEIIGYKLTADPFEGENKLTVEANNGEKAIYALVFEKEPAKTEMKLSNFTLTSATSAETSVEDNTHKVQVSGTMFNVTLPFGLSKAPKTALVPKFEISEGAKLYRVVDNKISPATEVVSGFGETTTPITVSDLGSAVFVVANESAVIDMDGAAVSTDDLVTEKYMGNVSMYTVEVTYSLPETGAVLSGFTAKDGKVTSTITSTAVTIQVPASFVNNTPFCADYVASKYATVKAGEVVLPVAYSDTDPAQPGQLKVISGSAGSYAIQASADGTSWTTFTQLAVISEDEVTTNMYDVVIEVQPVRMEADIVSAKVNGTDAKVDTEAKTVVATLPRSADITKVTLEYEVSPLATAEEINPVTTTDEDGNVTYDLTNGLNIRVSSEMGDVVKDYVLSVVLQEEYTDVPQGEWYYKFVMRASDLGIVYGNGDGTFAPGERITREAFAAMATRMMIAAGLATKDELNTTDTSFADENQMSDWAKASIAFLNRKGIMRGVGNDMFDPRSYLTREEAAAILYRALKLSGIPAVDFKDQAQASDWAAYAIRTCKNAGIFHGDENGNFLPHDAITRAEAAKILVASVDLP